MKLVITDVERITVDVPFLERPAKHMGRQLWGWTISEVCRVKTDAGIEGFGETLVHYTWGRVSEEAVARVIGRNPAELLWDDSLGAGLQMALFDLTGKALGVPCHRLMGQRVREWCPISWWAIDMPPSDWAREAQEAVRSGYTGFKIKARPWFDIREQVKAIAEVVPGHFKLDLDFNGLLLNAGHAVPLLQELERMPNVAMFESPISQGDIEGNKQVRAKTTHPIAMHYGNPPIMTALTEEVCDGFVIGVGAANVIRQGTVAAEAGKPFWLQLVGTGITTAWALHLGAVLTHAQWPAITCHEMYSDDLVTERIEIQGGFGRVPEAPGLGVELDEGALERLRTDSIDRPAPTDLYRVVWPDGQCTAYASPDQYRNDFMAGNQRVFEPGVTLEVVEDDDSKAFAELRARAARSPIREWHVTAAR